MEERHTFPDTFNGLLVAFELTQGLRRHGFKTHLVTTTFKGFTLHTVVATPLPRARTAFQKLNSALNR
jgi:hypothetical protein